MSENNEIEPAVEVAPEPEAVRDAEPIAKVEPEVTVVLDAEKPVKAKEKKPIAEKPLYPVSNRWNVGKPLGTGHKKPKTPKKK